ncbi:asparaginyl-tRNA synthetase [Entomoplasma freundtii]|uniref:Asparagine--tRNA ligase n=2 Tax=Entomoplasma freundtii TaxID=74700 RepID=A0A2K8NSA5_9MOLU|nr:asparagine--tRNA ligase [Entomoplasma freundtii]ATZ16634.1 asparaginyl-tRNA synthetase [Entomoplasma freundtii]TDY58199.1 asparaginyl-tRNA synthetase [Entomoplasma freundtii]
MTDLAAIFQNYTKLGNQNINLIGRVRTNRKGKKVSFMVVNDGTIFQDLQVVYKDELSNYENITKARPASIVEISGTLVLTPNKPQPFEIQATQMEILDQAIEEYPLQNKEHTPEFLRELAHLRVRTKTFNAIYRVRSAASFAFHRFFNEQGFVYVQTPILTSNDAEGAGETFVVTTRNDDKYDQDFFGKKAVLTVSGQLHAEAYAQAFRKVYTFGPTFRAEESYTAKHAAEFWMIEPEVAFADLQDNIDLIEAMLKSVTKEVWDVCHTELNFLAQHFDIDLASRLQSLTTKNFALLPYRDAIERLKEAIADGHHFDDENIFFGMDLATEHERFICEVLYNAPTFIVDYPKTIKSFYMKENPDLETVAGVDLLVPGIGELVGGSEREGDYDKLVQRCLEQGIDPKGLDWYLGLRRFGYYKSAGFGLGFERYLMYLTGVTNIRDVLLYPRTPKNLLF